MMTSFGGAITITPLELAAMLSAIANGGTLYYLQYPRTQTENRPVSRQGERRSSWPPTALADITMECARRWTTARPGARLRSERAPSSEDRHLHGFPPGEPHGWFGSFNDVGHHHW